MTGQLKSGSVISSMHSWSKISKVGLPIILLLVMAWGSLALYYQLENKPLRYALLFLWSGVCLTSLYALVVNYHVKYFLTVCGVAALGLSIWWVQIEPRLSREWADDVARISSGVVQGDYVVLRDVRNFTWRTENDYDIVWENRTYDLRELSRVDMFLSYWMGPAIAHTLVSFGFSDGSQVVFSVEIRKEKNEQFSALGGFFKKFEMTLIAADERDIIRTRTNARGEDVFIYSVDMSPSARRDLFLAYVEKANELHRKAKFYHTLTANCTTIVYTMVSRIVGGLPRSYQLLLSGYLPEYLYKLNALVPGVELAELKKQAYINERALQAADDASFSERIRVGVPHFH